MQISPLGEGYAKHRDLILHGRGAMCQSIVPGPIGSCSLTAAHALEKEYCRLEQTSN
jgi:hypothetical protein